MNLSRPEALLARLLDSPEGMPAPAGSESDTWRQARRELEARGHPIQDRGGAWLLDCGAAHFDPSRFALQQAGCFGHLLEVWESCDSTNSRAWEGVAAGMPPGWVVLAEEQRAGRGRQGRRWTCPLHGGLLFSLVVPAALAPGSRAQLLPLALASAACVSLRECTGRDVRLKWPNDLILQERKLAGLLVEARSASAACVVVGFGINVRVPQESFAAQAGVRAVSLHEDGRPLPRREEILARVLCAMEGAFEDWQAGRDEAILDRWTALDTLEGREVEAHLPQGVERGRALGITESGLLRLRLPSGEVRLLAAGEVHLR